METGYVQLMAFSIISYLITYLVGHTLTSFIKIYKGYTFLNEFIKLTTGFFTVFTLYAVYKTKGATINISIIVLFLMLVIWLKKNQYLRLTREVLSSFFSLTIISNIVVQLSILLFVFSILWLKLVNPTDGSVYNAYGDFYTYAKIIQHLNKTGIEGSFVDWHSGVIPIRNLYHFGELWYAAFYSNILKQTPFNVFYYQLFSHCLVIYFVGACTLIELFIRPKNKLTYLFGIIILFVCGISFYIPGTTIFTKGDWWDKSLYFQPKYFFSAVFVFYLIICCKLKKWIPLFTIAMAVSIACNVIAPAMFMTTGLLLLLLYIYREINFISFTKGVVIIAFSIFFIALFTLSINYFNSKNSVLYIYQDNTNAQFNLWLYLKTAFNCFVGQMIKSTLSLFLFIILFFIAKRRYYTEKASMILIISLLLHIMSVASYAIFSNRVDAVQLWTNVYVPFSAIMCFFMAMYTFFSNSIILKVSTILIITLSFVQSELTKRNSRINTAYLSKVNKFYNGENTVFFKSEKDYSSVFSKNINLYAPSPYLIADYKEYNPVCLSVFEIPISDDSIIRKTEKEIIENSAFYKFVLLQKRQQCFISIEKSQLDFINKYKIKYAFTYPYSCLPLELQKDVEFSIQDSIENITFYKLKD